MIAPIFSANGLAAASALPPGGNGTTRRTAFEGYAWVRAAKGISANTAVRMSERVVEINLLMVSPFEDRIARCEAFVPQVAVINHLTLFIANINVWLSADRNHHDEQWTC
jgi:hypothetical protein